MTRAHYSRNNFSFLTSTQKWAELLHQSYAIYFTHTIEAIHSYYLKRKSRKIVNNEMQSKHNAPLCRWWQRIKIPSKHLFRWHKPTGSWDFYINHWWVVTWQDSVNHKTPEKNSQDSYSQSLWFFWFIKWNLTLLGSPFICLLVTTFLFSLL